MRAKSKSGIVRRCAAVACVLGCGVLSAAAQAGAVVPTGTPLPESDYSVRPLCGAPASGYAACFAMELVPQTAAAQERATPLGTTVRRPVEPASAADGAFGLRPQDLHDAYSLPTKAPLEQTVAIVDAYDDPTIEADLAAYDQEFGLPECSTTNGCFKKVNVDGQESPLPTPSSEWSGEISLDVETVHAICQESCHILLVEASNSSDAALEAAEETAVKLGATEVSNSFGGPEPAIEGSAFDHPGVVIAASTGDYGYLNWSSSTFGFPNHPNYPASSPDVIAVGGTRVSMKSGAWEQETVWNDGSTLGGYGAGGSGCSEDEAAIAQPWQQAVPDWSEVGCGQERAAADVAADGDPYSGVAVYDDGSWSTIGGTSLASPIIAATFALAGGSGGVSYPAQTLYKQLKSSSLHDITHGSNGKCEKAFDELDDSSGCTTEEEEAACESHLICRAATGYDGPTGVGTPEGIGAFTPPAPTLQSISPDEGDLGTSVTIAGEDLKGVIAVEFGDAKASEVVEDSPDELTVVAPGHAPGQVDVTVTTAGGTSTTTAADRFTYLASPAIASVEPTAGPSAGGTLVTIKGERLREVQSVEFGGAAATGVVVKSETELTATAPAHAEGLLDVTVTTTAGTSAHTSLDHFTYFAPPSVSAVAPSSGSIGGGTAVTITGEHLEGASAVKFGDLAATSVVADSPTELTVVSPVHAKEEVDVTVTTPGGTSAVSAADKFDYIALPVIEAIEPTEGSTAGGTLVTIKGEYLTEATAVDFASAAGAKLEVKSGQEIEVESPAHGAGTVDVTVTTPVGTSEARSPDRYTYVAPPVDKTAPTIKGFPMEGRTLVEKHGGWENNPTSYTYQWLRCEGSGANCSPISGATNQTYSLTSEDVGHEIEARETAGNVGGDASATSAATSEVLVKHVESATWTGATALSSGASARDWSEGTNWEGGKDPGEVDIGTLNLPSLAGNSSCATEPTTDTCYRNINNIAGLSVEKLSIDDHSPYEIFGEPITLGAGGIEAKTTSTGVLNPGFATPITLGANQAWSVDGNESAAGVSFDGSITGETHTLDVTLAHEGGVVFSEAPDDEVGLLNVKGADPADTGSAALKNGILSLWWESSPSEPVTKVNAADGNPIAVEDVVLQGTGDLGPLTVKGGDVEVGYIGPPQGWPSGGLTVNGPLTLDSGTVVNFGISETGTTPGVDYTQMSSSGTLDLGGAQFELLDTRDPCPTDPAGSELALVSTSGTLEGTFANLPDGERVMPCNSGESPVFEMSYTEHAVIAKSLGPVPFNSAPPLIYGTAVGKETLRIGSSGVWQNNPTSYEYQWLRCEASGESCSSISGATEQTYTLTPQDHGHAFRLEMTARNAAGQTSATSAALTPPAPYNYRQPAITGSAVEGETLSASEGAWIYEPSSYSYRWLRCEASGANCSPISGATKRSYALTSEDVGHEIEVEVTAENSGGNTPADSAPTGVVVVRPAPLNTSAPAISGSAVEGETLRASAGAWEHGPTSYAYQWLRCDGAGGSCVEIAAATSATYEVASEDVGHTIEVRVTAENSGGAGSPATSAPTGSVLPRPPANTAPPSISGEAIEGKTLTVTDGSWSPAATGFTYRWLRCDGSGGNCSNVGSGSDSYTLTSADVGHTVEVEVTAEDAGGQGVPATTGRTSPVVEAAPTNEAVPSISGKAVEGETLTTGDGAWSGNPTGYDYQWLRCAPAGGSCAEISGATGHSYELASTDVGHALEVRVTAENNGGAGSPAVSAATAEVRPKPPANTAAPQISGSAVEGQTLTATNGGWEGSPTGYAYQWLHCDIGGGSCGAISGATGQTYQLAGADVGHTVEVQVTAENPGGKTVATSAASAVIAAQRPSTTGGGESKVAPSGGGESKVTPPPPSHEELPAPADGEARASGSAPVKGSYMEVTLTCAGGGSCSGALTLRVRVTEQHKVKRHGKRATVKRTREVVVASSTFSLAIDGREKLRLKLTAAGMAALRKAGGKGLAAQLAGSDIAGATLVLEEAPRTHAKRSKRA